MKLFEIKGKITPIQDKTNIIHRFNVPQGIKRIVVDYSYNPKMIEDRELARNAVGQGMKKYNITHANPESFMPVSNLITLSFDENGRYRGACHRQPNEQRVVIADADSTSGILNRSIESGEWDVMLNVHYVGCDVDYSLVITGEVD